MNSSLPTHFEKIHKTAQAAEGWLTRNEGALLYSLAQGCTGKGAIVEIGSWKGRSTIYLAKGSEANTGTPVTAIDPHIGSSEHQKDGAINTYEVFKENITQAKVDQLVHPIVKPSAEVAKTFDKKVEVLFIDGAHEYELVKEDLDSWLPHLLEGCKVAFHDSTWSGPKQLLKERVYRSKDFSQIWLIDSITVATYRPGGSYLNIIQNYIKLGIFNLRMLGGLIHR
jgi:predicted O-methyltransferase YrrM